MPPPATLRRSAAPWLLAVAFITFLIYALFRMPEPSHFLADPDGGIQISGAQQIAWGEHPFVHWRTTYGPLRFYLSYLARVLLDGRAGAEYLLCGLGCAASYTLMLACTCRVSRRAWLSLLLTATAFLLMPRYIKFYIVLGPLLGLANALAYIDRPTRFRLALMGVSIAIAAAYRLDVGLWAAGGCTLAVLLTPACPASRWRRLGTMSLWILLTASPWLTFLAWHGALRAYAVDSTYYGIGLAEGLQLPFPRLALARGLDDPENIAALAFASNYLTATITLIYLACRLPALSAIPRRQFAVVAFVALAALGQTIHRSDISHLLQGLTGTYVLLALALGELLNTMASAATFPRYRAATRRLGVAAVLAISNVACTLGAGIKFTLVVAPSWDRWADWHAMLGQRTDAFLSAAAVHDPAAWQAQLPIRLRQVLRPEERFFAMPYRSQLYATTSRRFAAGQMHLAPGYFSDPQGQTRMIQILQSQGLPPIVEEIGAAYDGLESRTCRTIAPTFCAFVESHYALDPSANLPAPFVLWRPVTPARPAHELGARNTTYEK